MINKDGVSVEKEIPHDDDNPRGRAFNGRSLRCRDIDTGMRTPRLAVKKTSKSKLARHCALNWKVDGTQLCWRSRNQVVSSSHSDGFGFDSL